MVKMSPEQLVEQIATETKKYHYTKVEEDEKFNNLNSLIKTDNEGNVYINIGFEYTYTLAETFNSEETYYETYVKITPSILKGAWVRKNDTTAPVGSINVTYSNDMAPLPYLSNTHITYCGSISGNYATYYYYDQQGNRVEDGSYPIWIGAWNACWAMTFTAEDATTLAWVQANHNKVSDNYVNEDLRSIEDIQAYDLSHPSYREIQLTEETFIANTYYTRESIPVWINVKDLVKEEV